MSKDTKRRKTPERGLFDEPLTEPDDPFSKIGFDDAFQYEDFKFPWEQRKNIAVVPNFERETCLKAFQAWTTQFCSASI